MQGQVIARVGGLTPGFAPLLLALAVAAQPRVVLPGYQLSIAARSPAGGLDSVAVVRAGGSEWIYFSSSSSIYRVPRGGGSVRPMASGIGPHAFLEAADERLFVVNSGSGDLRELVDNGGTLVVRTRFAGLTGSEGLHYVDAGPWQGLLLASNWAGAAGQSVHALDLRQTVPVLTRLQTLTVAGFGPLGIDTYPGAGFGSSLYVVAQPGQVYRIAGTNGGAQTLFTSMPSAAEALAFPPPGSPFGDYLYVLTASGQIFRVDPQGVRTEFAAGFSNSINSNALEFTRDGLELLVASDNESALYRVTAVGLTATPAVIAAQSGGTQTFSLNAGSVAAGLGYWLLGSVSGTRPGTTLLNVAVPLNVDPWLLVTLTSPNLPPYANLLGMLDANGQATATLQVPALAALAGLSFAHSFVIYRPATLELIQASNPVALTLQ